MEHVFWDAVKDTAAMIPWLFGIHIALEFLDKKTEDFITEKVSHRHAFAPLLGAIFGCMPQCGFSVIAATLYAHRCISLGTLLAVFLSTSDEAIPIMLSQQNALPLAGQLILVKIMLATMAGYFIDFCFKLKSSPNHQAHSHLIPSVGHQHCSCHTHQEKDAGWKTFIWIPLRHTLRISFFILLACLGLNALIETIGEDRLARLFFTDSPLQPVFAVLVGLIPNCAASVVITEIYLKGTISFGSAIAGLSASGGLGIVVLFKENKVLKENWVILGLLAGISLLAGWILNLF